MAAPPKKSGGFSLYADLLDSDKQKQGGTTISSAPVRYDIQRSGGTGDEDAQKRKDASLKFQPIKRPQVPQKAKPKQSSSSTHKFSSSTVTAATASSPGSKQPQPSSTPLQQPAQRSNFDDWVGDDEEGSFYQDTRRQQNKNARKNKNKNKNKPQKPTWDWDDIYDPTLPNNYADYKGSEEQHRERRDWKARLYYHQLKEAHKSSENASESETTERRPRPTNVMFAPPTNLNFAPPSFDNGTASPPHAGDDDDDYFPPPHEEDRPRRTLQPPTFAPPILSADLADNDVYTSRTQMTAGLAPAQAMPPSMATQPVDQPDTADIEAKRAAALAKIAAFKAKFQKPASQLDTTPAIQPSPPPPSAAQHSSPVPPDPPAGPPEQPGSTIARAPVRYELPPPSSELPATDDDALMTDVDGSSAAAEQPRNSRPGQKGFAERLLKKYGWEKGQGLGAQGDGITTAIVAKAEKRKKVPDAKGGGWAAPANMGKIVGGKKRKMETQSPPGEVTGTDDPRLGTMSEVIKLESMLDGLNVQHEIENNNLMQEIGDEMGSKYGNVERVFIWREAMGGKNEVFVKFTSQLSALRAVNAMMGTEFAGNEVVAKFWDTAKFEDGDYA